MLNDLIENKGVKCISSSYNILQKYLFPFVMIFTGIAGTTMLILTKEYFLAILVLIIFIAIIFYAFWFFRKTADEAYIDYENREFIFLYKIGNKKIRKNFNDMTSVVRVGIGQGIELVFNNDEKYLIHSLPFLSKPPYQEIKFILENRMGDFLTEQEEIS